MSTTDARQSILRDENELEGALNAEVGVFNSARGDFLVAGFLL
jgi:hypothetical protein